MHEQEPSEDFGLQVTGQYPPADITPAEFEQLAAEYCRRSLPTELAAGVETQRRIEGLRGSYIFDFVVSYSLMGMNFRVVGEAKRHADPVKRDVVQILHSKLEDVGAQKGILFSTSRFQSGALEYARTVGICLVHVTEGRFLYETKSSSSLTLSREDAAKHFGLPLYAGHVYEISSDNESISTSLLTKEHLDPLQEFLRLSP